MELIITAAKTWWPDWRELWRYRELFWSLAWRNILIHYKQTVVGVAWALLRPIVTMIVFTLIFGKLARFDAGNPHYPLLVFAGVLPWQFFANSLSESSQSVVAHAPMIGKIYFPRLIIPASAIISGLLDFLLALLVFAGMLAWYGVMPDVRVLWLPVFLALALAASLGAGLWLAALNVRYRDVRIIVPFLVQMGLYLSPVGFSSAVIPEQWRLWYALNPMAGVIEGFRWCLLGQPLPIAGLGLALSVALVGLLLAGGLFFFARMERDFADVI